MSWNQVILTKVGEELLSGMLNGSKLIITRAVIGDKTVAEEQLPMQTGVFSPISAPALLSGQEEVAGKNGTQIDIQIRNDGVLETSRMRQVGIFAKSEHHDEVLLGILQDETGEEIPAYGDFPEWLIRLSVVIGISRTNNINVVVNPHVFATKLELDDVKKEMENFSTSEITSQDIIIPTSGWENSKDAEISGLSVDVPCEGVTETMIPIVAISPTYDATTKACELNSRTKTVDGSVRFYAQTAPEQPITVSLTLLSPSGNTASGKLQPATKDRIGGVIIGDGVAVTAEGKISVATEDISATDADADDIINSIFGN